VVKATENVLRILEGHDVGGRSLTSRLRQELRPVAELLQGDADVMETLGDIHGARRLNGASDAGRAATYPRLQHPHPRPLQPMRAAGVDILVVSFQMLGGSLEARRQPLHLSERENP